MKAKTLRRRCLVDKSYQLSFCLVLLLSHGFVALLIGFWASWYYLFFFDRRLVHNHNETFWLYGLAGVLLVLLLVLFWGVRQSHRVAGVVVRVNKELENAGRGVFPPGPVCFRQRDYFKWLAPSLDATLKHVQREGAKLTTLRLQVAGLEARLATGELQKPEEVLNEVQRIRQSSEN